MVSASEDKKDIRGLTRLGCASRSTGAGGQALPEGWGKAPLARGPRQEGPALQVSTGSPAAGRAQGQSAQGPRGCGRDTGTSRKDTRQGPLIPGSTGSGAGAAAAQACSELSGGGAPESGSWVCHWRHRGVVGQETQTGGGTASQCLLTG